MTFLPLTNKHITSLLDLCMKGNQLAQMEVYNRYYKAMYNTALRIVKSSDEAEDAMQEAFLTAFTKLNTLKDKEGFGSWLKRIVINQSITMYRKQIHHLDVEDEKIGENIELDSLNDQEIASEIKTQEVLTAMDNIKNNYKTVLTLYYIEGYDYEEIAEIMNLSYANSRTMLSRAKESLRSKLNLKTKIA